MSRNVHREFEAAPSEAMKRAALEGLRDLEAGHAGDGLRSSTIKRAHALARGSAMPETWWRECAAWHARHGAQKAERRARRARGPARTAWLLWGGADGPVHARAVLRAMRAAAGGAARANPTKAQANGAGELDGMTASEQYKALRWGLDPRKRHTVETTSPRAQALVELGKLQALYLVDVDGEDVGALVPEKPWPSLAVGVADNRLYIVGGSTDSMAKRRQWGQVGRHNLWIKRTDYEAKKGKGSEVVYWYHDHEKPFPRYVVTKDGRPHFAGGGYHVESAGIVG